MKPPYFAYINKVFNTLKHGFIRILRIFTSGLARRILLPSLNFQLTVLYKFLSQKHQPPITPKRKIKSSDIGKIKNIQELDLKFGAIKNSSTSSPKKQIANTSTNKSIIRKLNGKRMFIGIGAMKSGTTWLSKYLQNHREVCHSPIKEVNFFNTLVSGPEQESGLTFRHLQMQEIILGKAWHYPPPRHLYKKLRNLAEVSNLNQNTDAYLEYFGRQINEETLFGEISPSYARLPPKGYELISNMKFDIRMFFIMRDPVARTISHLEHSLRRRPTLKIDIEINNLKTGSVFYDRSNYIETIRAVAKGAPTAPFKTFIFEELFTEQSIQSLCKFLEIEYVTPDFSKQVNPSWDLYSFSKEQEVRIREKLDPIYIEMSSFFGAKKPKRWRW